MAMSFDGFVARQDHALDWLHKQNTEGEDHGYDDFFASIDGLVMGRGSFETVLAFEEWPYPKPTYVMSKSMIQQDVPEKLIGKVNITDLEPKELFRSLYEKGWKRAYVDGGHVVHSFLRAGLIEDMIVALVPILIGEGRRMFGNLEADIDLQLIQSKSFNSGLVQNHYKILG